MKQNKNLVTFLLFIIVIPNILTSEISQTGLSGFKCFGLTKIDSPIRIVNNVIECFSLDGRMCVRGLNTDNKCREFLSQHSHKPRTIPCSPSNPDVCYPAREYFYRKWHCSTETGLNTGIRINSHTGEVECLSYNGRDCLWGTYGDKICNKVKSCEKTQSQLRPLQCGKHHQSVWGSTGYNHSKGHWCKRGFAFFHSTNRWMCVKQTGMKLLLRLSRDGEVECASNDGKNCIWGVSNDQCKNLILNKASKLKSLFCGEEHRRLFGFSGYFKRRHWCRRGFNLFYNRRINLFGPILNIPRRYVYRKVQRKHRINAAAVRRIIRNRLRNSTFFKIISRWSRINRKPLTGFWRRFKRYGWKYAVKTTPWWNRFRKFSKKIKININIHLKNFARKIKNLKKYIRNKRKNNKRFTKYLNRKWRRFQRRINSNPFMRYLRRFTRSQRINTRNFFSTLKRYGWRNAVERSKWWRHFVEALRRRNINYHKQFFNFRRAYRNWRRKVSLTWKRRRMNKYRWNNRGRFVKSPWGSRKYYPWNNRGRFVNGRWTKNPKRIVISARKWKKIYLIIRRNPVFRIFNNWVKKNRIQKGRNFWNRLRKTRWNTLKRSWVWGRFIGYARKSKINVKEHMRRLKRIVRKARPKYSWNNKGRYVKGRWNTSTVIWKTAISRIKRSPFWVIFSKWANKTNVKSHSFFKKLRRLGWRRIRKTNLWKKFRRFTNKNKINLNKYLARISTILRSARKFSKRKYNKNKKIPIRKWIRVLRTIRKSIFYNVLRIWSKTHKVNLGRFWSNLRNGGVHKTTRKTSWWKKFVSFAKKSKININIHLKRISKVIKKARRKYNWNNKGRFISGDWEHSSGKKIRLGRRKKVIPKKIWRTLKRKIRNSKLSNLIKRFKAVSNVNTRNFWKKIRKIPVKTAIQNTKWWPHFVNWTIHHKIEIRAYVHKLTMIIENYREKYGKYENLHKYIVRLPRQKWERLRTKLRAGRLWELIKEFKTSVSIPHLWKRFLKLGVRKGLKKSPWWKKFKLFLQTKNMSLKSLYRDFRLRFGKTLKRILYKNKKWVRKPRYRITWRKTKVYISQTQFWKFFKEFAAENEYNLQQFWKLVKSHGFHKGVEKLSWWSEFVEHLKKKGINIESISQNISKIIRSFRNKQKL